MSKQRIINTRFWIDDYTSNLDPIEKLLFLYFLSNPSTEICGVYEVPLKVIATDTGIDKDMVEKILKRFETDKKIFYIEGWVYIVNFTRHQVKNPSVEQGIARCLAFVPEKVLKNAEKILKNKGVKKDTLSPDTTQRGLLNLTKPNLTKLNLSGSTPKDETNTFFKDEELQKKFVLFLKEKGISEDVSWPEIKKFTNYWTEPNQSGTKQRWELQKTFDVHRRLLTWFGNIQKFNKNITNKYQVAKI